MLVLLRVISPQLLTTLTLHHSVVALLLLKHSKGKSVEHKSRSRSSFEGVAKALIADVHKHALLSFLLFLLLRFFVYLLAATSKQHDAAGLAAWNQLFLLRCLRALRDRELGHTLHHFYILLFLFVFFFFPLFLFIFFCIKF